MLEIELKFPVTDFSLILSQLDQHQARETAVVQEADHYFNAPDRDFARTDEALRLRRIGQANFVTYKGPKKDPLTKTRTEVEVALAEGDQAANDFMRILEHLGYRPVDVVRKLRRIFKLNREDYPIEVCLDQVEGLESFVELEIMAPEESLAHGRVVLLQLAGELGLEKQERRSYLELLLNAKGVRSA